MLELVTLEEAYAQLQIDEVDSEGSPHDAWLRLSIPGASGAVATWLKDSWRLYTPEVDSAGAVVTDSDGNPIPAEDSDGQKIVHPTVKLALLVELAYQMKNREGEGDGGMDPSAGHGYTLSKGATGLLSSLRKPTVV